jgi:hypothetical protein
VANPLSLRKTQRQYHSMGRSQVQRNKTHGRPGQGRGRGRGGSAGRDRQRQGSGDVTKLGDNSFRYDNSTVVGSKYQDDDYDGLLDAINDLGDYSALEYGIDGGDQDDLFGMTTNNEDTAKWNSNDYLYIDIAGLSKCLEQLPIHERLDLPMHVGKHLEDMYGGVRKKTLAELREDANVTSVAIETSIALAVDDLNSTRVTENHTETQKNEGAHDDEEDLEAWLDNMIS